MPKVFLRTSKRFKLFACNSFSSAKLCFFISFLLFSFCVVPSSFANNLSVSNATLVDQSSGSDTVDIQFDVSWENSWRDATNYDAVWVFAKYCTENCSTTGTWLHATMKTSGTNPAGFSRGSGTSLDVLVPTDKKGAFLQRSANGTGTVTTNNVELVWDYGADGVSDADAVGANTRIRVFGIEMVYIPAGDFYPGDGVGGGDISYAAFSENMAQGNPWTISSENALDIGFAPLTYTSAGNSGEDGSGAYFTISSDFPKGYRSFYMMKYEVTQGQYRDFLNCLTRTAQQDRVNMDISGDVLDCYVMGPGAEPQHRNGIKAPTNNGTTNRVIFGCDLNNNGVFNESGDGEWIAMNYMSWTDLCAYADWAALRPMTELEFEKAARGGSVTPVVHEHVWGTISGTGVAALSNAGYSNEASATLGANYNGGMDAPVRVGMYATATSTREQAGAGYYGAMELTCNVWERAVTVGNSAGRSFNGTHGDGALGTTSGNASNNSSWPGHEPASNEVTGYLGSGFRGGTYATGAVNGRTSDRQYAAYTGAGREADWGGRCVRTAES